MGQTHESSTIYPRGKSERNRGRYVYLVQNREGTAQRMCDTIKEVRYLSDRYPINVWRMSRGLYRDGLHPYGWDAPTFKLQSVRLAGY